MCSERSTPWAIPRSGRRWPTAGGRCCRDEDALDDHERELVTAAAAEYPTVDTDSFVDLTRTGELGGEAVDPRWFGAYGDAVRYTDSAYTEAWDGDPDAPERPEPRRAADPSEVVDAPSFCAFADHSLYDPDEGYYSTGQVRFGFDGDFWTYPQRMSPLFGWMVAESVRTIFDEWTWDGRLADVDPLTVLELGGGEGRLAEDLLDYVFAEETETWAPYRDDFRYVLGDRSAAMRHRQREALADHVEAGRVEVRSIDATALAWDGPFRGVIVANELLDALAHECLRVGSDGEVARVHVLDTPDGRTELEVPARLGLVRRGGRRPALPRAARALPGPGATHGRRGPRHGVPRRRPVLGTEPARPDGQPGRSAATPREPRRGHHHRLRRLDHTTASTPTSRGCASTPPTRSTGPIPTARRALSDLTWDVDFGEVARLARANGLRVRFAGPQGALEVPPVDLTSPSALDRLVPGRFEEGAATLGPRPGRRAAAGHRSSGSASSGFRVMMLAAPDVPFPDNVFAPAACRADRSARAQAVSPLMGMPGRTSLCRVSSSLTSWPMTST